MNDWIKVVLAQVAIVGAAGVVMFILDRPAPAETSVIIVPNCDPSMTSDWSMLYDLEGRIRAGVPLGECDIEVLQYARSSLDHADTISDTCGGCWSQLDDCEAGTVTARACRGWESSRFSAITDDLMDCADSVRAHP